MHNIVVLGAGKIGITVAFLLSDSNKYWVTLVDSHAHIDAPIHPNTKFVSLNTSDEKALIALLEVTQAKSVVSCLPYFCNIAIAEICKKNELNYFDLTEDIKVAKQIQILAQGAQTAFVPHCGLAPGFINIAAFHQVQQFDKVEQLLMRVGALPQYTNNQLKYALNWSVDGLINEYSHAGRGLVNGKLVYHEALEDLEHIEVDGVLYEAFNTSGGLGSLGQSLGTLIDSSVINQLCSMNYKTIRYPGHCELMRFLMHDLKLKEKPALLKQILINALPATEQDLVIIYIAITGEKNNVALQETYVKKIYPQTVAGVHWSAIQITTASALCAVIDTVLAHPELYKGMVLQESITYKDIINSDFGICYR